MFADKGMSREDLVGLSSNLCLVQGRILLLGDQLLAVLHLFALNHCTTRLLLTAFPCASALLLESCNLNLSHASLT